MTGANFAEQAAVAEAGIANSVDPSRRRFDHEARPECMAAVSQAASRPVQRRLGDHAHGARLVEAQSAREQQALIQYEKQILTAVEEVEVSLAAQQDERRRAELLLAAVDARRQALRHGELLHRAGQIDLLQLQTLQRAMLAADQSLVESHTQRALNAIQLYKALGGGWQPSPSHDQPADAPDTQTSKQS